MRTITIQIATFVRENRRRRRRYATAAAIVGAAAASFLLAQREPREDAISVAPPPVTVTTTTSLTSSSVLSTTSGTVVTPPSSPHLVIEPATIVFSPAVIGSRRQSGRVVLKNDGNAALTLDKISLSRPVFGIQNKCPSQIAPGATCVVTVTFVPAKAGRFNADLRISASGAQRSVAISARAERRVSFTLTPTSVDFGRGIAGKSESAKRFEFKNNTASPVSVVITLTPGDGRPFYLEPPNCGAIRPGGSCSFRVAWQPDTAGKFAAQLQVADTRKRVLASAKVTGTVVPP